MFLSYSAFKGLLKVLHQPSDAGAYIEIAKPNERAGRQRIEWVDAAKGFGIVLVVAGHELRGLLTAGIITDDGIARLVDRWIYSFHMPLFFFLAGLFVPKAFHRWNKVGSFLKDKLATVAYPYFVWSILTILLKSSLGSIPNTPRTLSDIPQIIYAPVEQYWFLYALFLIISLFAILRRLHLSPGSIVCMAALTWILPVATSWPILNVALSDSLYFSTGALAAGFLIDEDGPLRSSASLLLAFAISIIPFGSNYQPLSAFAGICFAIAFVQLLPIGRGALIILGRHALEIYLAHSIASAAVRILLNHFGITSPPVHLTTGLVAGLTIPLALGYTARMHAPGSAFGKPRAWSLGSTSLNWARLRLSENSVVSIRPMLIAVDCAEERSGIAGIEPILCEKSR